MFEDCSVSILQDHVIVLGIIWVSYGSSSFRVLREELKILPKFGNVTCLCCGVAHSTFQLNEGEAAYKMIRMQLQDLPLLLAGALGAAITGMIAPGLSFLFGEIQKVEAIGYSVTSMTVEIVTST